MPLLFHLTWSERVASIFTHGLIPNHRPNKWEMKDANERAKGASYLCAESRRAYWMMTYSDGWVRPPSPGSTLVWLQVNVPKAWVKADRAKGENYAGDFLCDRAIPPELISFAPPSP